MNDLVSRSELKKSARQMLTDENPTTIALLKMFDEIVDNTVSADNWIPVSERLPNICGVYNVTKRVIDGGRRYYITDSCYFDGTNTWHDDNRINFGREYVNYIIAWQPLPKAYKVAENDKE